MRIGLATDSTTDLPDEFVREHGIHILPSVILDYQRPLEVGRDVQTSQAFYQGELVWRGPSLTTRPATAEEIQRFFLERLVLDYDHVFLVTQSGSRSELAANARVAALCILRDCGRVRAARGLAEPFCMDVIDSQSLFAGPGVLCWQIADLVRRGAQPDQVVAAVQRSLPRLETYGVVRNLWYVRRRARHRGEHSISIASALLGGVLGICPVFSMRCGESQLIGRHRGFPAAIAALFGIIQERMAQGLGVPCIAISYAGDLEELQRLPAYVELARRAQQDGVRILSSMMSAAAAVWTGPGAITVGVCSIPSQEMGSSHPRT